MYWSSFWWKWCQLITYKPTSHFNFGLQRSKWNKQTEKKEPRVNFNNRFSWIIWTETWAKCIDWLCNKTTTTRTREKKAESCWFAGWNTITKRSKHKKSQSFRWLWVIWLWRVEASKKQSNKMRKLADGVVGVFFVWCSFLRYFCYFQAHLIYISLNKKLQHDNATFA